LSANKTEEAGEQGHGFEKQLEERILERSRETLLKWEKNNIKYTIDDFGGVRLIGEHILYTLIDMT
ncbi:10570_t:CDS:2, partial [Funneliformis geosporum]